MSSCTCDLVYNYNSLTHYISTHVEAMCIGSSILFIMNGMQKKNGATYWKKKTL
jgi:hypothetical protein